MKPDKIKSDYVRFFDSLDIKIPAIIFKPSSSYEQPCTDITKRSLQNKLTNINMHTSSPIIHIPLTSKATLSFKFKNGRMKFIPPYANPHQQTRALQHTNFSKQNITIYLRFYSHHKTIKSQTQNNITIKYSQEHFGFNFPNMQLFINLQH